MYAFMHMCAHTVHLNEKEALYVCLSSLQHPSHSPLVFTIHLLSPSPPLGLLLHFYKLTCTQFVSDEYLSLQLIFLILIHIPLLSHSHELCCPLTLSNLHITYVLT